MSKRKAVAMLSLIAIMVASGCSAEQPPQEAPSAESSSSPQTIAGTLDAQQVESIASSLLAEEPGLSVVGNSVMQQQLQLAKNASASTGISPEKCAEQMEKFTVTDLTGSVSATASSTNEKLGKVVQIFSLTDEKTKDNISRALTLDDIKGCEEVSIEQSGETLQAQRQILPLKVGADQSLTMSTQLDAGANQKLSSVQVQALKDNNFVIVTFQTGMEEPATLSAEAVQVANKAFELIATTK